MKPNFALNLTHDNIGLLHRTSHGWLEIGIADLDSADLGEALSYLRLSALGLSPAGFTTKIILPNSQILYDVIDAPGPSDTKRRNQIKKALEGRTPYAVEDLVFDWSGTGTRVKVAVVAHETLEEAEQFALQHKFNPVSFVAIPDPDDFDGEPFFGKASQADRLLQAGETVERDKDVVTIVARELPRPDESDVQRVPETPIVEKDEAVTHDAIPDPEMVAEVAAVEMTPEAPSPPTVPDQAVTDLADADRQSVEETEPADAEIQSSVFEPLTDAANDPLPDLPEPATDTPAISEPVEIAAEAAGMIADTETRIADIVPVGDPVADSDLTEPDAPFALDVEPAADDDEPSTISDTPAFSSRRQPLAKSTPETPITGPAPSAPPVQSPPALTATGKKAAIPPLPPSLAAAKIEAAKLGRANVNASTGKVTSPGIVGLSAERRAKVVTTAKDPRATPVPRTSAGTGLGSKAEPKRGKPRFLGLILTGILLLLLALVAAWSSFYMTSTENGSTTETVAVQPETTEPAVAPAQDLAEAPGVDDEMLADAQDPNDFVSADSTAEDLPLTEEIAPPLEETDPEAAIQALPQDTDVVLAEPGPEPAPETGTGDSTAPVPVTSLQNEIVLATMDAPPEVQGVVSLPGLEAAPDALPAAQAAPPPFGTEYQFDANGLIKPTAEGVITPEGVTLFSTRPVKEPPARPAALQAATIAPPPDATVQTPSTIEAAAPAALPFPSDPALADSRPQPRPEGLAPAVAPPAEGQDDTALSPPPAADIRLANSRPRARPPGVVEVATSSPNQTAAASIAAVAGNGPISPLALGISGRPAPRPGNFTKAVEAAVATALREAPPEPAAEPIVVAAAPPPVAAPPVAAEPAPAPPPAQAATLRVRKPTSADEPTVITAPEADDEPEADSRGPRVASSGTVAKRATFSNAINLSETNLIGVYGTSNARYALIRQSNGRYKKVKVGDRFDGGTVAAITSNEVRYQKSGRIYNLTLPSG